MDTMSQYISVRETAQLLGITEKKVMDLIEDHRLNAYRIANQFLRLKRTEVVSLRQSGKVAREMTAYAFSSNERLRDFFYFNDFYLFTGIIIFALLYIIFFVQ